MGEGGDLGVVRAQSFLSDGQGAHVQLLCLLPLAHLPQQRCQIVQRQCYLLNTIAILWPWV